MAGNSIASGQADGVRARTWQGKRFQARFWAVVAFVVVLLGAAFVLIPFLWMLTTALKSEMETYAMPPRWIPKSWMWRNFPDALRMLPFATFYRNTAVITLASMVGAVISSSLVAYGFARLRSPERDTLFVILLATMMLPGQVTLIPLYLLFNKIGWVNT
jgi:multiple sugar transport system permease protein